MMRGESGTVESSRPLPVIRPDRMRVLIDGPSIQARVKQMGSEIRSTFGSDKVVTCVATLSGSFVFAADLVRAIGFPARVGFISVASYHSRESEGVARVTRDLDLNVHGEHVLLIEDIVDTGLTLSYLLRLLQGREPHTLRVAALLDKPSRRTHHVGADHVGFEIPDEFVVGYGLDLDGLYRELPDVRVYDQDA